MVNFAENAIGFVAVTALNEFPVNVIGPVGVDRQTNVVECLEAASAPRRSRWQHDQRQHCESRAHTAVQS